ncbi:hypothetical protein [Rhodoferax sp.]|uniref:hypothetical protein n=1 Tax=Rhodoferax sp. TaxID=50421 RepID=UPI00284A25F9|nr:hypothetical protein [Rhodoferax sp.]MDR3370688.1 hypothetical protein [Rhodoferax sp.]
MIRSAIYLAIAAIAVAVALLKAYDLGASSGKNICEVTQLKVNEKAEATQKADTQAVIKRADVVGTRQERSRVAVTTFFNQLAKDQDHAPADPVDSCVLPAERLRRWTDANAGHVDTSEGTAPSQPDSAAPAVATSGLRPDARLGIQPPGHSAGLSPAGLADVQSAGLSGDQR